MRYTFLGPAVLCAAIGFAQQTSPAGDSDMVVITNEGAAPAPPSLVIYPDPNSGTLTVNWGNRPLFRMPVEVRTMSGRLMIMGCLSSENELDVSSLPDDPYKLILLDRSGVRAEQSFRIIH